MLERSEGKRDLSANGNKDVFENGGENFLMLMVVPDGLHNSVNILQTTQLCNPKGEIAWYMNCISIKLLFKKEKGETGIPWRSSAFTAEDQDSIPGWGTNIPQTVWCSQKNNNKA